MSLRIHRAVPPIAKAIAPLLAAVAFAGSPALAALHPGDKLNVIVYNHPELSSTLTLDAAGKISLPLAGQIVAENLEPRELASAIQSRLAPYVRHVAVQVQLDAQSDAIFVAGGPGGSLKYRPGATLASIVDELQFPSGANVVPAPANANDAAARPAVRNTALDLTSGPVDFHRVRIMREKKQLGPFDVVALRGAGESGPSLAPNDTIELANKPLAVSITGDVAQSGTAHLDASEPLSQAVAQAGGNMPTSALTNITLKRNGASQQLTLGSPEFLQPAQNGDVLIFPRAPRVDVLGTIEKPGETVLRGNATLVSALYYAGGPAKYANLRAVQVVHGGVRTQYDLKKLQKGGDGQNPVLADGDTVFVPQGSTFEWSQIWQAVGAFVGLGAHL